MTRAQLIVKLTEQNKHLSFDDSERVVDVFFKEISNALIEGNRVELRGFGTFNVKKQKPRIARNPRNGETIMIEEKKTPIFKIGKKLFNQLNGN